jgi:LacI family transcriptional regulator
MNLETIAKLSGVSRSTVSRVINNSPSVRPEVRERVLQVLRETNFQPNLAARGLAAGSTHILGLVVPQGVSQIFIDPYFPLLIQGVSSACNARDYTLMLWLEQPEYERRMVRQILHSGMIDGVIITSSHLKDPLVDTLIQRNFPFIVVGRVPDELPANYVDINNVYSARQAVEHMLMLGRRRIFTIAGPQTMYSASDRLDGYRQAMESAGITPSDEWIEEGDYTQDGGYTAMQQLLAHQPDGVFAASDAMALGASRAIQDAGMQVGFDIALVGFDDVPLAAHMNPGLTTIRQPIELLGQTAVELLVRSLNNANSLPPCRKLLSAELIIRQSCGAHIHG